jgi:hypothetical protein
MSTSTAALRKRLQKLEAQRNGCGWRVVEALLAGDRSLTEAERAEALAQERDRFPRGVSLEMLLAASFDEALTGTAEGQAG